MNIVEDIKDICTNDELFPNEHMTIEEQLTLLGHIDKIDQYCFYGRCLGFQVGLI